MYYRVTLMVDGRRLEPLRWRTYDSLEASVQAAVGRISSPPETIQVRVSCYFNSKDHQARRFDPGLRETMPLRIKGLVHQTFPDASVVTELFGPA